MHSSHLDEDLSRGFLSGESCLVTSRALDSGLMFAEKVGLLLQVEAGKLVSVENVQRPKPTLAEHKDDVAKRVSHVANLRALKHPAHSHPATPWWC